MANLVAFLSILFAVSIYGVRSDDLEDIAKCITNYKSENPRQSKVIDFEGIKYFCETNTIWINEFNNGKWEAKTLTPRQKQILDALRTCHDIECFTSKTAICQGTCDKAPGANAPPTLDAKTKAKYETQADQFYKNCKAVVPATQKLSDIYTAAGATQKPEDMHKVEYFLGWMKECRRVDELLEDNGQKFATWEKKGSAAKAQDLDKLDTLSTYADMIAFKLDVNGVPKKYKTTKDVRAVRKEIRMLSVKERKNYFDAIVKIKSDNNDGLSTWDLFCTWHGAKSAPGAHGGAAFLPWHREYNKQLEVKLRDAIAGVAIPYWDSTLDRDLPNPPDSILWSSEFWGNNDGLLNTGPFANFKAFRKVDPNPNRAPGPDTLQIYRETGKLSKAFNPLTNPMIYEQLSEADADKVYNNGLQLIHAQIHVFVGGQMGRDIALSPADPVFISHHSFMDFLYEEYRTTHFSRKDRETFWPKNVISANAAKGADGAKLAALHAKDAIMLPFNTSVGVGKKNIEGASNSYTDTFYRYDPRPTCTKAKPKCGSSPYLWCHTTTEFCRSKVRKGGECTGFEKFDICYKSKCTGGKCV